MAEETTTILSAADYAALTGDAGHATQAWALLAFVTVEVLRIRGAAWPVDDSGDPIYGETEKMAAALMIQHVIRRGAAIGLSSQSFGGHSTAADTTGPGGWPKAITSMIPRYLGVM